MPPSKGLCQNSKLRSNAERPCSTSLRDTLLITQPSTSLRNTLLITQPSTSLRETLLITQPSTSLRDTLLITQPSPLPNALPSLQSTFTRTVSRHCIGTGTFRAGNLCPFLPLNVFLHYCLTTFSSLSQSFGLQRVKARFRLKLN
jgi:hypothetical protein